MQKQMGGLHRLPVTVSNVLRLVEFITPLKVTYGRLIEHKVLSL